MEDEIPITNPESIPGKVIENLEGFLTVQLNRFLKGKGGLVDLLLALGVTTLILINFSPDIQILGIDSHSLLTWILYGSLAFIFVISAVKLLVDAFRRLYYWRRKSFTSWGKERITIESPRQEPSHPGREVLVPVKFNGFESFEMAIKVLGHENHWRAGVYIKSSKFEDTRYLFHVHVDENNPTVLQARSNYIDSGIRKDDKREMIGDVTSEPIKFQIRYKNGMMRNYVNNVEICTTSVDVSKLDNLSINAWADGKPYSVEFQGIELNYR